MRRPISRVRSVTDTSMMFMMPMPPTSRLTEATLIRSMVIVRAISTRVAAISSTVRTVKSSSSGLEMRWRWRKQTRDLGGGGLHGVRADRGDEHLLDARYAQDLLLDGRVRRHDQVVLVLAKLALALGGEHAQDPEGQVLDADHLAHGVLVGEEVLDHGRTQEADLLRHRARREE
jgi:hypothetical protein